MIAPLDAYFNGQGESRLLFDALYDAIRVIGLAEVKVGKSQVSFRRKKVFASAWMPGKYLRGKAAPLVLTVFLRARDPSPRWKEVVEPAPGRFTHHLELHASHEIDDEVKTWLQTAWDQAG